MRIRPAEPQDADAVARVHVRSWQVAYRGLMPDAYLDGLRPEERAARYTFGDPDPAAPSTAVAVEASAVCGFATVGRNRDGDAPATGELFAIYVDPDYWSTGVGRRLMSDARDRLRRRGCDQAILWVLVGNERAERFYRRDGWTPDGGRRVEDVWGMAADEIRYRRNLNPR